METITSFGPAGVANVGPCYDVMGYALDYVGDFVTVEKVPREKSPLLWGGMDGPSANQLQDDPAKNVAWVVAQHLLSLSDYLNPASWDFSVRLKLHKYLPVGSGLGSSAASGVAATHALVKLLELEPSTVDLVRTLETGEEFSSGAPHPDNVVPSYFGGFWFMCPRYSMEENDGRIVKLAGCENMVSIVVKPKHITITTELGREIFKKYVGNEFIDDKDGPESIIEFSTQQAAKAADMVIAVQAGDIERLGWIMRHNDHLEDSRGALIDGFSHLKTAAEEAGAYGCSISGSGPSVVAVTDELPKAQLIRDAMVASVDYDVDWLISPVGQKGAREVASPADYIAEFRHTNTFMRG